MKRAATTMALAVGVALVGGLLWWDQRRPSTDEAKEQAKELLPGFSRSSIDRLEVERHGQRTVLVRVGGAWTVDGKLRADEDAVDALLSELELGRVERRIAHADDALVAEVGLASPRARLRVAGATVALGNDGPAGHGVYARRDGDKDVLVLDRELFTDVDRAPEAWRSSRLLLTNVGALKSLGVGKLTIARSSSGWTVDGAPASDRAIDTLLDGIDRARAARFVEGAPPANGEALLVDGRPEARLGGACPGHADERLVTRSDGAALCFSPSALAPLATTAEALRDRRLFPFAVDAVTAVDLGDGKRTLALRRENGVWRVTAPLESAGVADDASVHAWLEQLAARTSEGGALTLTVRTAQASARHAVDVAFPDPLQFHDRRMIDLRPESIDRLEVDEAKQQRQIVREHHGAEADRFHLEPASPIDSDTLAQLIDRFAQLHAVELSRAKLPHPTRTLRANGQTLTLDGNAHECRGSTGALSFTLRPDDCRVLLRPLDAP